MKQLLSTILIFICLNSQAQQLYGSLGVGFTNKYLSGELNAGVRISNITVSGGYISLFDAAQPALFNARVGYTIRESIHVYGGPVWVMRSSDNKAENSKTWGVGAAYHFFKRDGASFYVMGNYSPRYPSIGIGMSANLFKQ